MTAWGGGTRPATPRSSSRTIRIAGTAACVALGVATVIGVSTKVEAAPVKPHTVYFVDVFHCGGGVQSFRKDTLSAAMGQWDRSRIWQHDHAAASSQVRMRAHYPNDAAGISHLVRRHLKACS